jgi:hypothetical protein
LGSYVTGRVDRGKVLRCDVADEFLRFPQHPNARHLRKVAPLARNPENGSKVPEFLVDRRWGYGAALFPARLYPPLGNELMNGLRPDSLDAAGLDDPLEI